MRRRVDGLAALAVLIALASLAAGIYLEYRLRPYRLLSPFTAEQRGWRDQAFEVGIYATIAACLLILASRLLRRV